MAIDTSGEKASLLNFGTPWHVLGPLPDGAFGQGEQQHLLGLYSGVLAEEAAAEFVDGNLLVWTHEDPGKTWQVSGKGPIR